MEEILALAKKSAEEAEVFMTSSEGTSVQFEANRLKHIQTKQNNSLALRIIKQGKVGYASASGLVDNQQLVNMALETARFGMEAKFELPVLTSYPEVVVYDPAVESVTLEEMVGLGEKMIAVTAAHTPQLISEADVSRSLISVSIINSRGGQAEYKQSVFGLGMEGQLIQDTDMLFVGESRRYCRSIAETETITEAVIRQLEMAKKRAVIPTGTLPVIFTPHGLASALIPPLVSAFSGKTVLEGASPLGNKLGQPVFDERLSLTDDPTLDYRPASAPCDDEGVPCQRTPLIEKGVVANFLYDLQTAGLAGSVSTGSGHRRGGLPTPSPSALIIAPGSATLDEMVGDIKEGLLVEQLMGASQGNILGGDFSGNVLLGYKVENGKIVGRVKDTMVSGNVFRLLKQIGAIGSEASWVGGFLNTPPIYFPAVSVASKG